MAATSALRSPPNPTFAKVARWVQDADYVLVGAGAGMSVEAGIDYNDTVSFARNHPAMVKKGFSHCYQFLGPVDWDGDVEKWGYLGTHVRLCLATPVHDPTYGRLHRLLEGKDTFVVTSNVDGLFEKTGFPADRIYTPQGDFRLLQCMAKCTKTSVWDAQETLDAIEATLDPVTEKCAPEAVPACPKCGGPAFMNVRGGAWFLEDHFRPGERALDAWVDRVLADIAARKDAGKAPPRVLVLDIGTGFNTPTVVRFRMEQLAGQVFGDAARFVRINRDYPQFHLGSYAQDRRATRCAALASTAGDALAGIERAVAALGAGVDGGGGEDGTAVAAKTTPAKAAPASAGAAASEALSGAGTGAGAGAA